MHDTEARLRALVMCFDDQMYEGTIPCPICAQPGGCVRIGFATLQCAFCMVGPRAQQYPGEVGVSLDLGDAVRDAESYQIHAPQRDPNIYRPATPSRLSGGPDARSGQPALLSLPFLALEIQRVDTDADPSSEDGLDIYGGDYTLFGVGWGVPLLVSRAHARSADPPPQLDWFCMHWSLSVRTIGGQRASEFKVVRAETIPLGWVMQNARRLPLPVVHGLDIASMPSAHAWYLRPTQEMLTRVTARRRRDLIDGALTTSMCYVHGWKEPVPSEVLHRKFFSSYLCCEMHNPHRDYVLIDVARVCPVCTEAELDLVRTEVGCRIAPHALWPNVPRSFND